LTANPFRMSADERFRYAHRAYNKAWSYLTYALEQAEGFVLITGKPGTGKTTLIRDILSKLDSKRVLPVKLVTNLLQGEELLRLAALEFGFPAQDFNKATLLTRIEEYALGLHRQGRRVVIIVDEAQNLSVNGLEELRLLSNLQAGNQPLFQVVLIGQEEIRSLIYGQGIENIQQRIVASCRLLPMQAEQVQGYIEHRLGIVGWDGDPDLDPAIYELLHRITHGVPREINLVAARLLLYGSLEQKHALNTADLLVVLNELDQEMRLAFDQTAILVELQEHAEAVERDSKAVPEDSAWREHAVWEVGEKSAVTTEGHEQEAEVVLLAEGATASSEIASLAALPKDSGDTPKITLDEQEAEPDVAVADEVPFAPEPEEWLELTASRDPEIDELASVRMALDEDRPRPQGLLTDVDELLGSEVGDSQDKRAIWRWLFYPLATTLLLVALLVPKPVDLHTLWYALWNQVRGENALRQPGASDRGIPDRREIDSEDSVQRPSVVASKPEALEVGPAEAWMTNGDASPPERAAASVDQKPTTQPLDAKPVTERASLVERSDIETDSANPIFLKPTTQPLDAKPVTERASLVERSDVERGSANPIFFKPATQPLDAKPVTERASQVELSGIETGSANPIFFEESGSALDSQSRQRLTRLAVWLHANPTAMVVVTGIAKAGDRPMARMRSALQRAGWVSERLVSEGISSSRIIIEGGYPDNMPTEAGACVRLKPMPDGVDSKTVEFRSDSS
ncbi:MAG: AAA family ATPase, partial [Candidatus Thiodiazotropha sp.]